MSSLEISRAQRLDQRVVEQVPTLTRSYAVKLIDDGKVMVNGTVVTKAGYKMRAGDSVAVDYDETLFAAIPDIELPVLYEDEDCAVINKPVGVLTHSKGAFNPEATVATWLRGRLRSMEGERAGIVHRLDRATSGVMMCAKTPEAHAWLQKQFAQRRVKKAYRAIISGSFDDAAWIIDMPLERNPKLPQIFRVSANGKAAQTTCMTLQTTDKLSLVELRPHTGRTHQLRVHMSHFGHPIVGDTLYNGVPADRLYLHALSLEVTLPNRERATFEVPMPAAFDEYFAHHG
ncbi:MAG TPA: RluA family pseudouridine synthase [Candidatus Limnocylindrales bacterium]|nr:RluA family pseudouridine synthase [Candidatus Limnocylindrales bacterium]